jgi:hypothetical protein
MRLAAIWALLFSFLTFAPAAQGASPSQLFVEWRGSYWPAHVVGTAEDGRRVIHYDGWDASWNEPVDPSRVMHPSPDGALFVEWNGSWWPAEIVARKGEDAVRVHYIGWGSEWDETVGRSRLLHLRP